MKIIGLYGYVYEFSVDYVSLNPISYAAEVVQILHYQFLTKCKIKWNVSVH